MNGIKINPLISVLAIVVGLLPIAHVSLAHEGWMPSKYSPEDAHEPSPLPDRVVLTWEDDPATTQSVTWRTDTSVKRGVAEIALASANGRAMKPDAVQAVTTLFESDITDAHYHSAIFRDLQPDTLYAYRVGDGENWTEYYHFKTASDRARPLASFISGMRKMMSERTGRGCSERHFEIHHVRPSHCMRGISSMFRTATQNGAIGIKVRTG